MKTKPLKIVPQKSADYESPKLKTIMIGMEQGIAAGSAAVVPPNASAEVLEEWDIGTDREQDINW